MLCFDWNFVIIKAINPFQLPYFYSPVSTTPSSTKRSFPIVILRALKCDQSEFEALASARNILAGQCHVVQVIRVCLPVGES